MKGLASENNFSLKTTISLVVVCLLLSIFIPFNEARGDNPYLIITKLANKTFALPGDEIVYTLNYRNNGQGRATGIVIKDPFYNLNQHYLEFISASPNPDSGNDTWIVDSLDYGQSGQIIIRARISKSVPIGSTEIRNRATIDSNETILQYSNYVSTLVSSTVGLNIDKLVRNVSTGGSFVQSVNANPGDEIEFSLAIRSTGSSTVSNVRVWDTLPNRLNYISGTTMVNDSYYSDGIANNGLNIGSIGSGQTKVIKFKAQLEYKSSFNAGTTILTNFGYVEANNVYRTYDSATVIVSKESTNSLLVSTLSDLRVDKLARNITKNSTYWTDVIYVEPEDEIEFLIKIQSPSNKEIDSIRVEDELPPKLIYISDSTTVDGNYEPDGIISKNVYIGTAYPYLNREIKFKARIVSASNFNLYPITLVNTAYAWGSDGKEIKDSVKIIVRQPTTSSVKGASISLTQPLSLSKLGRNISKSQTNWSDYFSANPEEEIEFSIQVSNTGNADLNNVRVWDILPNSISIISGTTTINGVSWGGDVVGSGLALGILRQGETKTIKFKSKIASADNFTAGSTTLINTVYATADNVSQISDQASAVIYKSGQVLGAGQVKTGVNFIVLIGLIIISCFIAFFVYCRLRENKLLEILSSEKGNKPYKALIKFYFRLKYLLVIKMIRFKKVYW